ncbi:MULTISPECIES: hypothetical protein [unclassified Mesorhizobium]|uniref:hypothetical protein n=1 Tax=unclassified Mesorhizobium TaxID=325217 RepID=UPI0003CE7037|nr:hypothetical protein [Mesorhizobium sp. LSHC420B00]ESX78840.1 hypothetical protein X759_15255 [Mesorhizobium sp. LSHC420B00]
MMLLSRPAQSPDLVQSADLPAKGKDKPSDQWKTVTRERVERLVNAYRSAEKSGN